jgi:hypothetical protein
MRTMVLTLGVLVFASLFVCWSQAQADMKISAVTRPGSVQSGQNARFTAQPLRPKFERDLDQYTKSYTIMLDAVTSDDSSSDCVDADPSSVLAGIQGDFELNVDPQDPAGNLIYISNVSNAQVFGPSSIVAARVDGVTGIVVPGSLITIANNFFGEAKANGPEFVELPTGELGVLYGGQGGVHGVFRSATPTTWNGFGFDVYGTPIPPLQPPALFQHEPRSLPAVPSAVRAVHLRAISGSLLVLRSARLRRYDGCRCSAGAAGIDISVFSPEPNRGFLDIPASAVCTRLRSMAPAVFAGHLPNARAHEPPPKTVANHYTWLRLSTR